MCGVRLAMHRVSICTALLSVAVSARLAPALRSSASFFQLAQKQQVAASAAGCGDKYLAADSIRRDPLSFCAHNSECCQKWNGEELLGPPVLADARLKDDAKVKAAALDLYANLIVDVQDSEMTAYIARTSLQRAAAEKAVWDLFGDACAEKTIGSISECTGGTQIPGMGETLVVQQCTSNVKCVVALEKKLLKAPKTDTRRPPRIVLSSHWQTITAFPNSLPTAERSSLLAWLGDCVFDVVIGMESLCWGASSGNLQQIHDNMVTAYWLSNETVDSPLQRVLTETVEHRAGGAVLSCFGEIFEVLKETLGEMTLVGGRQTSGPSLPTRPFQWISTELEA
uniref:RNase III domain-containing protein n=1 Tax=Chromera velia CCMP2878 TaxID=1169474 RepID=A0A0G4I254_9ALVE|eukprot:Cvel_10312.t1-p1 / transcript=Cvel_10312.t1 / gene=Cvel_10312 / organism=Chromera_velia_CCMP2878 / gene_product=hypothetical protein / transcript_product=hypothetical protein / location=Cvel_scaffold619:23133-27816(-) / protein_length=339 / sequence_SO=supercontig / SO=protein_coding / is_pseudo=false